jgi:hypothetical protein
MAGMPGPADLALALLLGLPVWIAGVHFFDLVHWFLHGMLRSRWRALRWLATPHAMHHRWLDRQLRIRWDQQRANLWGHIVLEYATQLVFSAALLLVLPAGVVAAAVLYQTLVFGYILSQRGLDVNHRPIEVLDAYRPSPLALPAYHALHHVYPDAHYSAYSKLVDYAVGSGVQLRGRRFAVWGGDTPFAAALCRRLERAGVPPIARLPAADPAALADSDVLVIADPQAARARLVEAFIEATRGRQLPPEVWAVHAGAPDGLARHYWGDPRVSYRAIAADPGALSESGAGRAAAAALFFLRRGLHYVPTRPGLAALAGARRFRRTPAAPPAGVALVRHRAELAGASA